MKCLVCHWHLLKKCLNDWFECVGKLAGTSVTVLMASMDLAVPAGWAGFLLFPWLQETGYLVRLNKAFFLLFKDIYDISHGVPLPVSCYLFTSICIASLFVHNKSHCSNYYSHLELWNTFLSQFPHVAGISQFSSILSKVGFCIRAHFSDGRFLAELPDS